LERAIGLVQVTIQQLDDFSGGAWFLNLVQRSRNVLAETKSRIWSLLHREESFAGNRYCRVLKRTLTKGKGCDIGYALAANSCEGANSVEACTVTALDAITAFAVPNPNFSSQSRRFFQVWLPFGLPRRTDHSAYFGLAKFYFGEPFQPSTEVTLTFTPGLSMPLFSAKSEFGQCVHRRLQSVELLMLSEWMVQFSTAPHAWIHNNNDQPRVSTLSQSTFDGTRIDENLSHPSVLARTGSEGMPHSAHILRAPGELFGQLTPPLWPTIIFSIVTSRTTDPWALNWNPSLSWSCPSSKESLINEWIWNHRPLSYEPTNTSRFNNLQDAGGP
jgi:hypothetical protein